MTPDQINQQLALFRDKFGPAVLAQLDGKELLLRMYGRTDPETLKMGEIDAFIGIAETQAGYYFPVTTMSDRRRRVPGRLLLTAPRRCVALSYSFAGNPAGDS